ncbi:hypothetical protein FJM67_04155 [Maribrevibacterium harenarium]|uniref:Uncharacterized protein n=1 Tax=Maribrevibacterium harenarium TaxID=2589817 RepID=A0A501X1V6_9GAMM|nr:hypothetical protein [Maribrevibacterium harenarium]TPE54460.1 hypothetical protein FJM67_04155 [Maribrevibacterium harenarium]
MARKPEAAPEEVQEKPKRKLPLGKIAGFGGTFLLSVAVSSGITIWLTSNGDVGELISSQINDTEAQIQALRQEIEIQNATITALQEESEVLRTYLRHSSSTALKNILVNQEENIQGFLAVMRQAIGDLGDMLPQSSEWETLYQYQTDLALKASMERATLLRLLKTGEPPKIEPSLPAQSGDTTAQ